VNLLTEIKARRFTLAGFVTGRTSNSANQILTGSCYLRGLTRNTGRETDASGNPPGASGGFFFGCVFGCSKWFPRLRIQRWPACGYAAENRAGLRLPGEEVPPTEAALLTNSTDAGRLFFTFGIIGIGSQFECAQAKLFASQFFTGPSRRWRRSANQRECCIWIGRPDRQIGSSNGKSSKSEHVSARISHSSN
jgi:hypothetical protein